MLDLLTMLETKKIIFVGSEKKARDLEFLFDFELYSVVSFKDCPSVCDGIKKDDSFLVFENEDNKFADTILSEQVIPRENYCLDSEIIEYLNMKLSLEWLDEPVAIWGVGKICDYFLSEYKKIPLKDKIKYFICSERTQKCKNGIPIRRPEEIDDSDIKIVAAVDYQHFYEIGEQCANLGIGRERYIYYTQLMQNPGDLFGKTYYDANVYPIDCLNRDRTLRMRDNGNLCMCCMTNDAVLGNIFEQGFEDIWTSLTAKIYRLSLVNHTYTFCRNGKCFYLRGISTVSWESSGRYDFPWTEYPESISPEVDMSCNLSCSSCRTRVFSDQRDRTLFLDIIKRKISPLPVRLIVNTVGEPLASKNCLDIISYYGENDKGKIDIYTNGTLLTPARIDQLLEENGKIRVSISVDAASKATYEKIRRGGHYERLVENIKYISLKRRENKVTFLCLNYVVQRDNVFEMKSFVQQAKAWNADEVRFSEIENWGIFSEEEFDKLTITENGQIKDEYRKFFEDDFIDDPVISWLSFSNILGIRSKYIMMI